MSAYTRQEHENQGAFDQILALLARMEPDAREVWYNSNSGLVINGLAVISERDEAEYQVALLKFYALVDHFLKLETIMRWVSKEIEYLRKEQGEGPVAKADFLKILSLLADVEPEEREYWYKTHRSSFFSCLRHLSEWDSGEYQTLLMQLMTLTSHFLDVDTINQEINGMKNREADYQKANEESNRDNKRGRKAGELQAEAFQWIKANLEGLATQDGCWQHILDHSKTFIGILAKLYIVEKSACEPVIEKLLPMIGRRKVQLEDRIKEEAKILKGEGFGNDFNKSKDGLSRSNTGVAFSNFANTDTLFRSYLTSQVIGWDMFHNKIVWKLKPVWESEGKEPATDDDAPGLGYRLYHESDVVNALVWLNNRGLDKVSYDTARKVIRSIAYGFQFNSFHDYLGQYRGKWDGVDRLSAEYDIVKKLFGTKYKSFVERKLCNKMFRKQLLGWVERGLFPGCDFRTMLHLIGDQRVRKSTWIESLAGPYYVAYRRKKMDPHHPDNYTQMVGYSIGELAESSQLKSWDYEVMKESLSTKKDNLRKPYAEDHILLARSWVLFGTSNNEMQFLPDPTGNTRHFTIRVDWNFDAGETIPIEWFEREIRGQLIAQLLYLVEMEKENNWLDRDDSLLHKEYMKGFEIENDAAYIVEKALEAAAKLRPSVNVTWYPGFRFEELYEALSFNRRKPPTKNNVTLALQKLGLSVGEIHHPRQNRWFIKATKKRKLDKPLLEEIADRTNIFTKDF